VGTRRGCIKSLLDGRREFLQPFLAFLVSVTRVRTHAIIQGEITLAGDEREKIKTGSEELTVSGMTRSTLALIVS
jgi:hypothetical protein